MRKFKTTFMGYHHVSPELEIRVGEFSVTLEALTKGGAEIAAIEFAKKCGHRTVIPKRTEEIETPASNQP